MPLSLQYSLENASHDKNKYQIWIEEDYCSHPLAMEREEDLNWFFEDINVRVVFSGVGRKE